MTFATWTNEQDEQNRRDRLARIYRDARRAEREPGTRPGYVAALVIAGLLLACSLAAGCDGPSGSTGHYKLETTIIQQANNLSDIRMTWHGTGASADSVLAILESNCPIHGKKGSR
jgi:hypothetical protein